MKNIKYPNIKDRVKSAFFDSLVVMFMMYIASDIFLRFENVSSGFRIGTFIIVSFLYDPIAVAFFGGTIGHHINNIKIKRESNMDKNILIHTALIRFLVKVLLGWLSLLTISSSDKRRTIHDIAAGSVAVFKDN